MFQPLLVCLMKIKKATKNRAKRRKKCIIVAISVRLNLIGSTLNWRSPRLQWQFVDPTTTVYSQRNQLMEYKYPAQKYRERSSTWDIYIGIGLFDVFISH